jgi:hypothetical protein
LGLRGCNFSRAFALMVAENRRGGGRTNNHTGRG